MKTKRRPHISPFAFGVFLIALLSTVAHASQTLHTKYANLEIDDKGFIVSLVSNSGKEYSPPGHPSPLLTLHEFGRPYSELIAPIAATYDSQSHQIELKFPNGATAIVKFAARDTYFRFQLVSLTPRGDVDNITWGPVHTTISQTMGDIIGVVRNQDWAIGLYGLDDNTIAGPPLDSDAYEMGYYIHSPDPVKYPLPPQYHEGQLFSVGGDGVSDVAFYSHPEEYFRLIFGTGARLEPEFGSSIFYHSRDRRRSYTYFYSLIPGFEHSRPRHQVSDPIDGVDFIGSAVALYACPDDQGLKTIESIILAEKLPHPMIDGKWVRDPAGFVPMLYWNGPVDKEIEYATALGLKNLACNTDEFYPSLDKAWIGKVSFSDGRSMTYKDFAALASRHGMTHGGLHTLCLFLQGGISHDVTPVPSKHLQTVLRTKLARDISATDTGIEVTDPSFLAEKGTWPQGDDSNYLVVGAELMRYESVTTTAPYIVKISKRGHFTPATPHKAGDELVKLQQDSYNGFAPDMTLMLDYADYYAKLMADNGMQDIDFDGEESTLYQNQGYYAVRCFFRRFFDTYAKLTGGKAPFVTGACVFTGAWEYMNACNAGGGNNMFDPVTNQWGIEGKDIRNGFSSSYYPATFGIQEYHSDWSLYDAENLEAKSIGWDATYALSMSQDIVDRSGEKDAIFKAIHAWETGRAQQIFTPTIKKLLRDLDSKFHLEQTGPKTFVLTPIKEIRASQPGSGSLTDVVISNPFEAQPLQFALQVSAAVNGCKVTLPDGRQITCTQKMDAGQFIICKGSQAYLADHFRKKIAELPLATPAVLPAGKSNMSVQFPDLAAKQIHFDLTVWLAGTSQTIGE